MLERNRGRVAVPLSELPASRDEIRRALLDVAEAEAKRFKARKSRVEFYKAGLVELEAFVSDANAELVDAYEQAKSEGRGLPARDRERAERVIRTIHARQASLIRRLIRPDDLQRMPTVMALGETPAVIGGTRRSLDAVDTAQELQAAGWLMTFLDIGAVVAAFAIHGKYHERPGGWLVAAYTLPILFVGGPLWMAAVVYPVLTRILRLRLSRPGRRVAQTLLLCVGIVTPAAVMVLPTLFLFSDSPL